MACHALSVLGSTYGSIYPSSSFIGYSGDFSFVPEYERDFGQVVNKGALARDDNQRASLVVEALLQSWNALSDEFAVGRLSSGADAFIAAFAAAANAERIGVRP